jgi:hypothetical protein
MNRHVLCRWFCAFLLAGLLILVVSNARAQDPGNCGPIQENGECKKQNGTACQTSQGAAGTCKSEQVGGLRFTCQCVAKQEKKDGGGSSTSLMVFLGLLTIWLGFRGTRWLRSTEQR